MLIQSHGPEQTSPLPIKQVETPLDAELLKSSSQPSRQLTSEEMAGLEMRLSSRKVAIRTEAELQVNAMDSTALTAFLAYERQSRSKRVKRTIIGLIAVYAFVLSLSIFAHLHGIIGSVGAFTGVIAGAASFTKGHKAGALALARFQNTESVSEL